MRCGFAQGDLEGSKTRQDNVIQHKINYHEIKTAATYPLAAHKKNKPITHPELRPTVLKAMDVMTLIIHR